MLIDIPGSDDMCQLTVLYKMAEKGDPGDSDIDCVCFHGIPFTSVGRKRVGGCVLVCVCVCV